MKYATDGLFRRFCCCLKSLAKYSAINSLGKRAVFRTQFYEKKTRKGATEMTKRSHGTMERGIGICSSPKSALLPANIKCGFRSTSEAVETPLALPMLTNP